jgi:hypothetical protein
MTSRRQGPLQSPEQSTKTDEGGHETPQAEQPSHDRYRRYLANGAQDRERGSHQERDEATHDQGSESSGWERQRRVHHRTVSGPVTGSARMVGQLLLLVVLGLVLAWVVTSW